MKYGIKWAKNGMGIDKSNRIKNKENKRGKIVNKTRT